MKLEYKNEVEDPRKVVAEAFHMTGCPESVCLNIHIGGGKVATIYEDGTTLYQNDFNTDGCSIKKFYKGDTITITF